MRRVSIAELVRQTGLSRATIDRALNGRSGVHARTRKVVEDTLERLSQGEQGESTGTSSLVSADPCTDPGANLEADIVLRIGHGMMEQLHNTRAALGLDGLRVHDLYQQSDADVLDTVRSLCANLERPLVLTVKNTEALLAVLQQARKRGKRIVSFVSDLHHDARDAFVGIDNRMAGQSAAHVLGMQLGHRDARVAIVLGDYAFRCHEDREIGFRALLRSNFPRLTVVDVVKGGDSAAQTHGALAALLHKHGTPDAIYNVAGGNKGIARALEEAGIEHSVTVLSHEANHITGPLMVRGVIDYVIAQHPQALLKRLYRVLDEQRGQRDMSSRERDNEMNTVNFAVYTRYNLPDFANPKQLGY